MAFDPSTARPIEETVKPSGFDPSTARPIDSSSSSSSSFSSAGGPARIPKVAPKPLQFDPSTATPAEDRQGRLSSAAGSFVKGAVQTASSFAKGVAISESQSASAAKDVFDALDSGEIDTSQDFGSVVEQLKQAVGEEAVGRTSMSDVMTYLRSPEHAEATRKARTGAAGDPRDNPIYQKASEFDQWLSEKIKTDPEFEQEFLAGKLPQGMGSMVSFLAAGLATGGNPAAVAVMGAESNAGAEFEDALRSGASLEQALEASDVAELVGTSEALPITRILNRVDKNTGGSIKKTLSNMVKSGTEEGLQEAFQQVMSNLTASDIVGYDPDRGMWEGSGEGAGVGFTTGALTQFLVGLLPGRQRGKAPEEQPQAQPEPTPTTQSARRPDPLDDAREILTASDEDLNRMLDEFLMEDAETEAGPQEASDSQDGDKTASVPVMITQRMRAELRDMGYTDEDIRSMRPQEANDILAQQAPTGATETDSQAPQPTPAPQEETPATDPTMAAQDRRGDPVRQDRGGRRRLQTPKDFLEQRHREKVSEFGLTPEQAEAFAPRVGTDPTTGYFEKRDLEPTIERAQQHVEETGEPGVYVETDISNMGGGNAKLGTRQFDEQFYTPAAKIMREELEGTGADVIPIRKGGDENGFIVVNGAPEVIEQAMNKAQSRIGELASETGLADVPHTKEEARAAGLRGVGLYYGISNIRPGDSVSQILSDADTQVEVRKKEQPDVNRSATQTPEAEPPDAGRAGQGVAAPGRGGPQGRPSTFDPATARPVEQEPQTPADAGVSASGDVAAAAAEADPAPTEAQRKAGNYKKGHVRLQGLDISIENPAGSQRRPEWPPLKHAYGYIRGTTGKDKDHIDVFLGPRAQDPEASVFVVDQVNQKGAFDEHKVMMGFDSIDAASEGYLSNYSKDWTGLGDITEMSQGEFKQWLNSGNTRKPVGDPTQKEARDEETQRQEPPETEVLTPQTFDSRRPGAPSAEGASRTQGQTQASRGNLAVPLREQTGDLPVAGESEVVMADGRVIEIPDEPVRRRDIVKRLEKAFGVRVYQGKVKGKSRLGFYRKGVGEIRTKDKDNLEVTSHELAHWLDDRFVWVGNLYRSKPLSDELKSISYEDKKLSSREKIAEGYAEFMRLFMTDESMAIDKAPNFYRAFIDKLKGSTLEAPVKDIQGMMHAWYRQGSLQRARSKIGESPETTVDKIKHFRDWLTSEFKDQFFDDRAHIAKVEKTLNGRIGGSYSPYWSSRILQRVGAIADAVIHHGTIGYDRQNGFHYFTGESLDSAVLSKIEGREREYAEYAIGRRAQELMHQGRENNFTKDEVDALLGHSKKHEDFLKIFQAQQAFNKRMVDFLVESGVTSRDKADKMMEINQNYVSFKRVIDSFGKHGGISKQANPFMRLKGGTSNIRNMFETMQENIETFIHLGVLNQFKTQFYQMIDTSQDSAMFATRIGRDVKPVQINKSELASRLNKILGENWQQSGIQIDEEMLSDLVLFTSVEPKGDVDFYYKDGEQVFYQIGDGSLYKELLNIGGERLGLTFKIWDFFFGKPKRLLTTTATALNLKFQFRNFLMRDLANRVYFTRARKDNPIRVAGQAFKGLADSFRKSDAYWLARANGLGMESTYVGSQYAHTKKASIAPAFNWWQKATLGKDKTIDALIEFVGHPEMANRLAEYEQLSAEGKTPREAAVGGIDVSVDFRRRGRHELIRYIATGSAFFNPRIQGLYKIGEEMTNLTPEEKGGYMRRRAAVVAARALWTTTLPAMVLWYFNHDDERYQNLPDDVRDQNFIVFYGPDKDDYFAIAKSFEMGSVFASVPERLLDAIKDRDGRELAESMALMAAETLSLNPLPSAWQIEDEIDDNKTWTGAPIIPNWLNDKEMEKARYFDDRTSQTARWLGEKLDIRPDHLEHRFRGYTSMIGDLTLSMTDYWLRQENKVDPKMTYQDYVSRYIGILPKSGEPYRTEAQKDFYELATEADKVFNTYEDLMDRPGNYETLDQRLQDYLNPPERKVYYATREAFEGAREIITDLNNAADLVRQDENMSAEAKREEMEKIKKGKNQLYKKITEEFSPEKLKELEAQID